MNKIRRQDYDTYEEWREAWSSLMEPVISGENFVKYQRMLANEQPFYDYTHAMLTGKVKWDDNLYGWLDVVGRRLNNQSWEFFVSVMDNDAMQRNLELAEKLGIR